MKKLRVAILGCGDVSRGHIQGWLNEPERAEITALVDLKLEHAATHQQEFSLETALTTTDYDAILHDERIVSPQKSMAAS